MLAFESSEVVRMRLEKFAHCDDDAGHEAQLMVSEKIAAAFEAAANWLSGATPGAIIDRYREHVAANAKRLSASETPSARRAADQRALARKSAICYWSVVPRSHVQGQERDQLHEDIRAQAEPRRS